MKEVRELDVREPNRAAVQTDSVLALIEPKVEGGGIEPAQDVNQASGPTR